MYKTHKLVLLSTDKEHKGIYKNCKTNQLSLYQDYFSLDRNWYPQHLYLLSDEKIEDKAWGVYVFEGVYRLFKNLRPPTNNRQYSIIATTDNNISINLGLQRWEAPTNSKDDLIYTRLCPFPTFPQSFINHFISEYNKGNQIDSVEIEYETYEVPYCTGEGFEFKLKINSDNTISIKPIKDSYSRKEVIAFSSWYSGMSKDKVERQLNKYHLEQNL